MSVATFDLSSICVRSKESEEALIYWAFSRKPNKENNFYGILRIPSFPLQDFIWNFPRKFVAVISECLRSTEWKLEAHAMRFLQVLLAWNGLILMLIISPNTIDAVFRTRVWPIWRKCYLISIRTCLTTIHWLLVSKNNSHEANEWLL